MMAAQEGHTEVVKLLLERGANPRQINKKRETAADIAANSGHTGIVTLLK